MNSIFRVTALFSLFALLLTACNAADRDEDVQDNLDEEESSSVEWLSYSSETNDLSFSYPARTEAGFELEVREREEFSSEFVELWAVWPDDEETFIAGMELLTIEDGSGAHSFEEYFDSVFFNSPESESCRTVLLEEREGALMRNSRLIFGFEPTLGNESESCALLGKILYEPKHAEEVLVLKVQEGVFNEEEVSRFEGSIQWGS